MHFYGLYKLLPKLVQFWSGKWIHALSKTRYSVFSPGCLLTSFSIPLCTLSFALASPSSQNKCVFNLSTLKTQIEPVCLHSYISLVPLICKHAECCLLLLPGAHLWLSAGPPAAIPLAFLVPISPLISSQTHLGDSVPSLTYLTYWLQGTNSTSVSVLKFTSVFVTRFIHSQSNWKQIDVSLSPCQWVPHG